MLTLPDTVIQELFDLDYQPSEVCLNHIIEQIESLGLVVKSVKHDGAICSLPIAGTVGLAKCDGNLQINRSDKVFTVSTISVFSNGMRDLLMPITGSWHTVYINLQQRINLIETLSSTMNGTR